ncbi:MAG: multicopper oxidase domain-containing protein [Nocardiopsaceae bacterium]|nr:multicopper oxidase domain-containing protein [Nocardiopsaceae bacterium]
MAAAIDPGSIPKYVTPLFIMPAMPPSRVLSDRIEYQVAERRIAQQVLPAGMPKTLVNGYGAANSNGTFHAPGWTLENTADKQTRVTWINQLVDSSGNFQSSLLTVDPTIHWANPPGGVDGRDSTPTFTSTPPPYTGPQPMVVHLHGTHDFEESDGLPETWWLPVAKNIPQGFATVGTDYNAFKQEAHDRWGVTWAPGSSTSVYPNDQRATQLMYHDHVLGMTRLDVHTGLVGWYNIRGGDAELPAGTVPGPAPQVGDPEGKRYYEIGMILQDKSFNPDGSLFFPDHSDLTGPYIPDSDIPPYWNSTVQGTTSTVNGNTWPVLEVEPRRYRFRILDMDNFRTYQLKIVRDPIARPGTIAVPTWVIGADGGLLPQAQPLHTSNTPIFMVTTERVDLIVDFTGEAVGNELFLINAGVTGDSSTPLNDVNNVGQIMKFKVVNLQGQDRTLPPDQLPLPARRDLGNPTETHRVSMNVIESQFTPGQQKRFQMGRVDADGTNHLELWSDPISQVVTDGSTALWEVWNEPGVGGGHAFHIHLVEFQITERERLDANGQPTGVKTPLSPWELGEKDTVFVPPQQITRFIAPFDHVSRFIYHCHFVDHEDHEMMRPFRVQ